MKFSTSLVPKVTRPAAPIITITYTSHNRLRQTRAYRLVIEGLIIRGVAYTLYSYVYTTEWLPHLGTRFVHSAVTGF